jgi:hypothetical protein
MVDPLGLWPEWAKRLGGVLRELPGALVDTIAEGDNSIYRSFKREQRHLVNVVDSVMAGGGSREKAIGMAGMKFLADATGGTDAYEAATGEDLEAFVSSGNMRTLKTEERVERGISSVTKAAGAALGVAGFRGGRPGGRTSSSSSEWENFVRRSQEAEIAGWERSSGSVRLVGDPDAAPEVFFAGGYDSRSATAHLSEGYGHFDGMGRAGGIPHEDATPGVTLFVRGRDAAWANASQSLNATMKASQLDAVQLGLERALPNKVIKRYETLNDAIEGLRARR